MSKSETTARDEAHALATRLGDGWEPDVFENLNWYYAVKKGCVTVRPEAGNSLSYSAWIEPNVVLNRTAVQVIAYGPTPEDALGNAIQDARTMIARFDDALSFLNDQEPS